MNCIKKSILAVMLFFVSVPLKADTAELVNAVVGCVAGVNYKRAMEKPFVDVAPRFAAVLMGQVTLTMMVTNKALTDMGEFREKAQFYAHLGNQLVSFGASIATIAVLRVADRLRQSEKDSGTSQLKNV